MSEMDLIDMIVAQALQLQRVSAGNEAEAEAILRELERELRQLLASQTLSEASKREVEAIIKQADAAIAARYSGAAGVVDTQGVMVVVAENTAKAMEGIAAGQIRALTAERLASLARAVLIDGAPSAAWWARQAEDTQFKFAGAVRQGIANGETQERIVARIAGRDGFMEIARRNARTLVHSSVMTAANRARLDTYRNNAEHADGVRWLATLDSNTCLRCSALDGAAWDFDGKPIEGNTLVWNGGPPAHFACRCVASVIPKSLDKLLGIEGLDKMIGQSRASSVEGPIKGDTSMTGFLKRNPAVAEEIMGKARVDMFLAGKLTLRNLVSGTGRPLTLDELANR
jgi:SPP1 gp7 family putative phage head morphogenesis protein